MHFFEAYFLYYEFISFFIKLALIVIIIYRNTFVTVTTRNVKK